MTQTRDEAAAPAGSEPAGSEPAGSGPPRSELAGSALAAETFFVMARASAFGSSDANRALQEFGLKVRHYSALVLAGNDPAPTQRELSQFLALDPSQIVAIVDDLERAGWVKRAPDPRDRRSKTVRATAAGRAMLERARTVVTEATAHTLEPLDAAEQQTLHALLSRVAFSR